MTRIEALTLLAIIFVTTDIPSISVPKTLAETCAEIAHFEKHFYTQITEISSSMLTSVIEGGACLQLPDILQGKKIIDFNEVNSLNNDPITELSSYYREKIIAVLSKYYTSEQIAQLKLSSAIKPREKIESAQLQQFVSASTEIRTIAAELLSTAWAPILNSIHAYKRTLYFDEKLCETLSCKEFELQCHHMASRVIDQIPLKLYAIETWHDTGIFDSKEINNYSLLLLKKYTLLTAQEVKCASISYSILSGILQHYDTLFRKYDARIKELHYPALTNMYDNIKKKVLFYQTEVLPILEQMTAEQAQ